MVIAPPDALNSSSCPLLKRACRRTAGGTTSGTLLLFLTATVMVAITFRTLEKFHLHDSRRGAYQGGGRPVPLASLPAHRTEIDDGGDANQENDSDHVREFDDGERRFGRVHGVGNRRMRSERTSMAAP
jgi:hypothetical protein